MSMYDTFRLMLELLYFPIYYQNLATLHNPKCISFFSPILQRYNVLNFGLFRLPQGAAQATFPLSVLRSSLDIYSSSDSKVCGG